MLVLVAVGVAIAGPASALPATHPSGAVPVPAAGGSIDTGRTIDAGGTIEGSVDSPGDAVTTDVRTIAAGTTAAVADSPHVLIPVAGYSRFGGDGSDALDHETRRRMHDTVADTPGIHLAGIADAVGEPVSTVRYHGRVLEREGLVETEKIRGKKRLFPTLSGERSRTLEAALADGASRTVLHSVWHNEPTTVSELAERLDRAPSTVCHHLCRLAEDELVTRDRDGERVLTTLTDAVRTTLNGSH